MTSDISIYRHQKKVISSDECDDILDYIKNNFYVPNHKKGGLYDKQSNNRLLVPTDYDYISSKIYQLYSNQIDFKKYSISLINSQEYSNGRGLRSHIDSASHLTTVCLLTDRFTGGDFFVENNIIKLCKGDLLIFNGGKYYHGLSPVVSGYRVTLNVWFKYSQKSIF